MPCVCERQHDGEDACMRGAQGKDMWVRWCKGTVRVRVRVRMRVRVRVRTVMRGSARVMLPE